MIIIQKSQLSVALGLLLFIGCADMDSIYAQVINDSIAEYNIAKRQGDLVDICVHAGLVAAAYLQAQDEANYGKWKQKERTDCKAAEDNMMREFGL